MTATEKGLVAGLGRLTKATETLETHVDASASLGPIDQAAAIAVVQDLRRRLTQVENSLAITLGKAEGQHQGNLPDGRQFTLKRTAERKAWDHEDWKRDARRAIVKRHAAGLEDATLRSVNLGTGEVAEVTLAAFLHTVVAEAQEVHGSTAPRSTALRRLGLYASDYCESSPGGWKFDAIAPKPTTDTQE